MKYILIAFLFITGLSQAQPIRVTLPGSGTNAGGSASTPSQIRAALSAGQGLGYDATLGQFFINNTVLNTQISNYLKSRDGFALGKILQTDGNDFVWITPPTGGTSTSGGSTTVVANATTPYDSILANADTTLGRIDVAAMSVINLTTPAQIRAFLTSAQTNKDGVIANGVYNDGSEYVQTGAWSNVRLRSQTRKGATLRIDTSPSVFIFNNSATRERVRIEGINFVSNYTGSGNPVVWSTELVPWNGYEFCYNDITANGKGVYNGFNIQQYSVGSSSGAQAKNIFVHDNDTHDVGRAGSEILSQGYDQERLKNLVFARNRYTRCGLNDQHGFGISLSGLIRYVLEIDNVATECKGIGFEIVNARDIIVRNARVTSSSVVSNAFGISDDAHFSTGNIFIENSTVDVTGRPFYAYDSKGVNFSGGTYLARQGVDQKSKNGSFKNMTVKVWDATGNGVAWNVDNTSTGNTFQNLFISNADGIPNGATSVHEPMVFRAGANNNTVTSVTTVIGQQSDGSYFNSGAIVNNGTGNTFSGNTFSQQPNSTTVSSSTLAAPSTDVLLLIDGNGQGDNSTIITDRSTYGHSLSLVATMHTSTSQRKYGTSSLTFNGSSEYIKVSPAADLNLGTGSWTYEAWIYPTAYTGAPALFGRIDASTPTPKVMYSSNIEPNGAGASLNVTSGNENYLNPGPAVVASDVYTLNQWHHIALVSNGSNRKLYHNGVLISTSTAFPTMEDAGYTKGPLLIGSQGGGFNRYQGFMHMRLSKSALYTTNFTPPASF